MRKEAVGLSDGREYPEHFDSVFCETFFLQLASEEPLKGHFPASFSLRIPLSEEFGHTTC